MSWRTRFRAQQYVKNSLWLAPFLAGIGGLVLAEVLYALDMRTDLAVLQFSPETATAVVSATIAAVVSLTGFVITVTVLGVQQATGLFSPRYMRLWYRDGRLKLVLAELVGRPPGDRRTRDGPRRVTTGSPDMTPANSLIAQGAARHGWI